MSNQCVGQGMGRDPVVPDWPPITDSEATAVLALWGRRARRIQWHSPRPFSAAALIELDEPESVFLKRHHSHVRSPEALIPEHAFIAHLRRNGMPIPEVLRAMDGRTAVGRGTWTYEVHAAAPGADTYREALSWTPYIDLAHAESAGRTLASLHVASAGFTASARPFGPLTAPPTIASSSDPIAELGRLAAARPALAAWLESRRWSEQVGPLLVPWEPVVVENRWGHGDWHPTNLMWGTETSAPAVTAILDFGFANQLGCAVDLAIAIERSSIGWLDLADGRRPAVELQAIRKLLHGYRQVRPIETAAVARALPLAHVDQALAEVEYFAGVLGQSEHAALAWDGYLCGHLQWWGSSDGRAVLDAVDKADR